ncbi:MULTISPECIES: FUSC family protein [Carnobacterium]|uniref:Aromatic acid exporter family protein n=1 Tax=Carnobacterium antarcticum TaxID=2126436 RepID=A0ABW4NQ47_9LACT|nr:MULTISPECIES: aromatic acid exporter family protein [unclassified Carnobacterium]ALV21372.1 lipoprotein [Carnobacterium sp. CP1]QQP69385.1 aromatic acid exporter family protein [Carnobacterium sp. CS13]
MRIGARTLKTGIAITLALAIPYFLNMQGASVLAAISAIFALQPSLKRSVKTLKDRVFANLIGGVVAIIMNLTLGNHFMFVGLAAVLLIAILNQFNLGPVIGLATVTLIVIMMSPGDNFILSASIRILATFIGVVIAFLVNTLLFPPKYEEKLYHLIDYTTSEIMKWIRASVRKNIEYSILKKDLKWVKSELDRLDVYFSLLKDESTYVNQKKRIQNLRKVVVYRQIISTTKVAYNLAKILHLHENSFNHFPEELRIQIRERLETLMSAHEQILLKFNGRVSPDEVNFIAYKESLRTKLMQSFFDEASMEVEINKDYTQSNAVIHIMSSILKYEEYLLHLNTLVTSFKGNDWNPETQIDNIEHIEQ